jgi:hypothetical protein
MMRISRESTLQRDSLAGAAPFNHERITVRISAPNPRMEAMLAGAALWYCRLKRFLR